MTKIAILGGGSWGTGLSVVLANSRRNHEIALWVREPSIVESIKTARRNKTYLPAVAIPACVLPSTDLAEVLDRAPVVVSAVPSAHTREVFTRALPYISRDAIIVSATKGLEPATQLRTSEVLEQVFSLRFIPRLAVLSGPSFAFEAARGEPEARRPLGPRSPHRSRRVRRRGVQSGPVCRLARGRLGASPSRVRGSARQRSVG